MRVFAVLFFVAVCLTLLATPFAVLGSFRPDFAICIACYIALRKELRSGILLCFLLGYAKDIFVATPVGLHSFCLSSLYLFIHPLNDKFNYRGSIGPFVMVGFLASLFAFTLESLLRRMFMADFSFGWSYVGGLFLTACSTSIATPFVDRFLAKLASLGGNSRDTRIGGSREKEGLHMN